MKKTIWLPIVIGVIAGILMGVTTLAHLAIEVGSAAIGLVEIFGVIAAALGGPLAAVIASIIFDLVGPSSFPWPISLYLTLANVASRSIALLVVAFGYRFLQERAKKNLLTLTAGWFTLVAIYYFVALLPLQFLSISLIIPDFITYADLLKFTWPEFLATAIVTSLVWLALPRNYQKPLWFEAQKSPDQNG